MTALQWLVLLAVPAGLVAAELQRRCHLRELPKTATFLVRQWSSERRDLMVLQVKLRVLRALATRMGRVEGRIAEVSGGDAGGGRGGAGPVESG